MDNIINFDDLVIKRNHRRLNEKQSICSHLKISYSNDDMSIECEDCEATIEPFKAFMMLVYRYKMVCSRIHAKENELNFLLTKNLHLKAARRACDAWASRSLVPACPHCNEAIFSSDGFGHSLISKEIVMQKRKQNKDN